MLIKRIVLLTLIAAVLVWAGLTAFAGGSSEEETETETYIVGTSADWPPFEWKDGNGNFVGFDIDVMRMIAGLQGYSVEFKDIAFDGLPAALKSGKIDIIVAGWSITPERQQVMDFTNSYWSNDQSIMVREDSDLTMETVFQHNRKIGGQTGSTQADWLKEQIDSGVPIQLELYETNDLGVLDLNSGRIDAFMADEPVANAFVASNPIKVIGVVETNERLGFSVAKGDPENLLPRLNGGIDKLREMGVWEVLVSAYTTGDLKRIDDAFEKASPLLEEGDLEGYADTLHEGLVSK